MRARKLVLVTAVLAALTVSAMPRTTASASAQPQPPVTEKDFSSFNFHHSTTIDNRFLPLIPGTQFTLDGTAVGTTLGAHQVIFTVTDVTKWVDHVRTLIVWDRDIQDGVLAEEELALFAQDDGGNVWLMGENPDVYDNGSVTANATWLGGRQRAIPGVAMRVDPRVNTSSYLQGRAPSVGFIDEAKVIAQNQRTCVPAACFNGVLVVNEFDPNRQPQDGHQLKYHAPGVGVVRVEFRGGTTEETLVLSKVSHLSPGEMSDARERTIALDQLAYKLAPTVWRGTSPADGPDVP